VILRDIIRFRGDRLFNGAVNIGWYISDEKKAKDASEAFVFHGPEYHGVKQDDVGFEHGHKLIDTASITLSVVKRCLGYEDVPFTLAIAGYGTGKSHLGLTIAQLLKNPISENSGKIIHSIRAADKNIGNEIQLLFQEADQPFLVIALNGMQGFDFVSEISRQIIHVLKSDGHDTKDIENLRPRFQQAANLVKLSHDEIIKSLLTQIEMDEIENVIKGLEEHDETIYSIVHDFFSKRGMPISAISGESVRDIIDLTVKEFCGLGKPYKSLVILFDEFGKYTEFASVKSQIAGNGVLQDLFESIQANSNKACFIGFIQFELNAYLQRIAPEYKNEMLRYVSRYQSASKFYLSINLETLIANLIEKKLATFQDKLFDNDQAILKSARVRANINKWFPNSTNHRIWKEDKQFHSIIRKGCWPLSAESVWLLFHFTAVGNQLQERSAFSLLSEVFSKVNNIEIKELSDWELTPSDLWSDALQQELISTEEAGQHGSITLSYSSVISKYGARYSINQIKILQAIVLASKLGLFVINKAEAMNAIGKMSGLLVGIVKTEVTILQDEFNVIEWDDSYKSFDILGDAVPRTQFISFIRQRVASSYNESGKSQLFAQRANIWCNSLSDLTCDFAEENKISTKEWYYKTVVTNLDYLQQQIAIAAARWEKATGIDEPKGTVIYAYIGQSSDKDIIIKDTLKILRSYSKPNGAFAIPILIVFLWDENGNLGQTMAELAIIEDMDNEDRRKFGNLVDAQKDKLNKTLSDQIEIMLKQKLYVFPMKEEIGDLRLSQVAGRIFKKVYSNPISFPFDGFSTARGNAADTCYELTLELLNGKLDWQSIMAKPIREKNRAKTVLNDTWGIYTSKGDIAKRPKYKILRSLTEKWDNVIKEKNKISIEEIMKGLLQPPYGANIASAGLILGVYFAARKNIIIVNNGQQMPVTQWLQENIFIGKYINLLLLNNVDIVVMGDTSSEWESLLDEWEQCEDHISRENCLERAVEQKKNIPIPPELIYREERLRQQAEISVKELDKFNDQLFEAKQKNESGIDKSDVGLISWGTGIILSLLKKMEGEKPLWLDSQIEELMPFIKQGQQEIIQIFSSWLPRQLPNSESPDDIGSFKHKMLNKICKELENLKLDILKEQIESHTKDVIKNAETSAEAKQLLRDVSNWLTGHRGVLRIGRLTELRAAKQTATDYTNKLRGLDQRIFLPEIKEYRLKISEFMKEMKAAEGAFENRFSVLLNTELNDEIMIEDILKEIESLMIAFDGLSTDLDDLRSMHHSLIIYRSAFKRLSNMELSWEEFDQTAIEITNDCKINIDDEIPWRSYETIYSFKKNIMEKRVQKSMEWCNIISEYEQNIAKMSAAEANRLYIKMVNPPKYIFDEHLCDIRRIRKILEERLSEIEIEWLIEKFKALSAKDKSKFLELIKEE
jgi:hypothetical protein